MGDWLVRNLTVFGVQGQNWMLIALAIILIGIVLSGLSFRGSHIVRPSQLAASFVLKFGVNVA
jgi:hypothetical protein